jgi:hypothetical protein
MESVKVGSVAVGTCSRTKKPKKPVSVRQYRSRGCDHGARVSTTKTPTSRITDGVAPWKTYFPSETGGVGVASRAVWEK